MHQKCLLKKLSRIFSLLVFLYQFNIEGIASATVIQSPIHLAIQITAETEHVHSMDISSDGKYLLYALEKNGFCDLWIRSADPNVVLLPQKLTNDPATEYFPAFSPDGKYVAYVGNAHDVKGDIYLLDLENKKSKPFRLTGRQTEDAAPCFSPDGCYLYFHQKQETDAIHKICFF